MFAKKKKNNKIIRNVDYNLNSKLNKLNILSVFN